jgi:hypothetical protein
VRGRIGGEPPFICDDCVEAIFLELFPLVRPEAGSPLTSPHLSPGSPIGSPGMPATCRGAALTSPRAVDATIVRVNQDGLHHILYVRGRFGAHTPGRGHHHPQARCTALNDGSVPVGFSWEDRWLMTRKPGLWRRWGSYRPAKYMLFRACVACTIATMVIGFNGVDG